MSICGYGFSEPEKEICGDDVPAGQKYCDDHTKEVNKMADCTCPKYQYADWSPFCDTCGDEGCADCANGTVYNHKCSMCEWEDQQHALGQYREDLDSGYYDRDPRDYF